VPDQRDNLEVLVAWLDAVRRRDLDAVASLMAADVVWRGIPADAICHNRREVLDMLSDELRDDLRPIHAVDLIAGPSAVALGVRSPQLNEIGGEPLAGQLFNVFQIGDGCIVAIDAYAKRDDALRAAGADDPGWA
jgi:ketosteroid isomerase-like protein